MIGPFIGPSMIYSPPESETMQPGRRGSIRSAAAPARSSATSALQSMAHEGPISIGVNRIAVVHMRT